MEVIFDTTNLRPVLSPTMRTTLSVISLIANSLIEANKCMKERLADEAAPPTTLDQVMQQSGLKIPGLEEALARLMGGGGDAKQAASMIVNTPDPVKLLQTFAAQYGFAPTSAERPAPSPIVTPPPAANNPPSFTAPSFTAPSFTAPSFTAPSFTAPSFTAPASSVAAAASGRRLAPFRADFTREGREAAKAAAASPSSGLPQFRQDFIPEGRQATQVHNAGPAPRSAPAPERLSLVGGVARQLDTIRRHRKSFEEMVHARMAELEAELARLREEFAQLHAALLSKAEMKADEVAATQTTEVAGAAGTDAVADAPVVASDAAIAAETGVSATGGRTQADVDMNVVVTAQPTDAATEGPLPPAATAEEVVQAIELIEEFAAETTVAEAQQIARIAAAEQEVARMRSLVQSAREAHAAGAEARGVAQVHV